MNTDSNGNATFSGVSLNKVGSGYTLTATDSSGTPLTTTSGAFNITAGAASAISFTTQPSNTAAGASITPAIVAHVQDAGGNPISGDGVTLTIANNAGGAGTGLTGGSSVNTDSNGNATFGGVSLNKVGTGYTLTATDSSGTPLMATSGAFNITAGAASAISFTTQPSNATAGASIAPAIVAHVQDAGGNAVSGDGVTLTIANNAGGAGTVLTGGSSVSTDGNGNATFSGVSLNKVGTAYTLTATDSSGTARTAHSGAFKITAGAASAISFATQPSNATAGANITPAIVVHVQDVSGNAVSGDGIVLAIGNNVGGSSLTGGGLVSTDSNGNATFSGVSLNKAGSGYTLQATDSSATPLVSTSSGFSISAAVPAVLTFSVQPSDTTAGVAISPAVQVSLIDAFGNLETGDSTHSVTLALAAGSDPTFSGGNAVTLSAGVATFPAVELTLAASGYKLSASTNAGAFTATSIAFSVNPAAVVSLRVRSTRIRRQTQWLALRFLERRRLPNPINSATL